MQPLRKKSRQSVIVLGGHRSGTSAFMGALYRLGVHIGSRYIIDHYENSAVVDLNEELLRNLDSTWDDTFPLPVNWWQQGRLDDHRGKSLRTIAKEFGQSMLWGLKDPRMCLLLPFWLPLLDKVNATPVFILPLRDPFEIAASHQKRDNFGLEKSIMLWMKYFFSAEFHSRGYARHFCYFDDLLQTPIHTLSELGRHLGVTFCRPIDQSMDLLDEFLQPSKKHHSHLLATELERLPQSFVALYRHLFVKKKPLFYDQHDHLLFDTCRSQFEKDQRFFLNTTDRSNWVNLTKRNARLIKAMIEHGGHMIQEKRHDDAIAVFRRLIDIAPERYEFWNNLGVAYEVRGALDEALKCFNRAADMESGYTLAQENIERVKQRLNLTVIQPEQTRPSMLYLGLVQGEGYGWGVCSRYLIQELSKIRPAAALNPNEQSNENQFLPGTLFQALINVDFDPMFPKARGERNFGYTFFENELTERSKKNARQYDLVLGGSGWCRERMLEKGISNCAVLIQGIDPELFYPIQEDAEADRFVIFSGGKFELRKGQDLVLRAVKIMQDKHPDVWLVNCWYNLWPASTRLMRYSPHIRFEHHENETWRETMLRTYAENGLESRRIITHELLPQARQRDLFAQTDIGLFPNRCEGGTNLVLMEYMACAKPVIVSNTSGHKDVVTERNAMLLNRLRPFNIADAKGALIGRWQEPSLDEIVAQLEYAYHHRAELKQYGRQAGEDLKQFTWGHSTRKLLEIIES